MANSLQLTRASSRPRRSTCILAIVAVAALSACGGSQSSDTSTNTASAATDAAANTTPATAPVSTTPPSTASTTPSTSAPPVDSLAPTDPPATNVGTLEMTPELAAFAAVNGELVNAWSTQLNAFGEEALDHLDDVSKAPAAASVAELSAEVVEAVDEDSTDTGLLTLRTFADGMTIAIGYAADGDQDSALSVFLGLQAQSDALTAVLDQLDA